MQVYKIMIFYIHGDYNISWKDKQAENWKKLKEVVNNYGLKQLVTEDTHVIKLVVLALI